MILLMNISPVVAEPRRLSLPGGLEASALPLSYIHSPYFGEAIILLGVPDWL